MTALVGGGIALSLGLAFGVLRMTMHAMSAAGAPARSSAALTTAGLGTISPSQ